MFYKPKGNKMRKVILCVAMLVAATGSGCATKNYGRQGELTDYERQSMTCREIEIERAKMQGYLAHITKESKFDGRSVLSFLGDFGIGNIMERTAAIKTAEARSAQLQSLSLLRECTKKVNEKT